MTYAKSLRIIGQSFENAKLQSFELETDGSNYVVQSDSLDTASEWILRQAVSPVARESISDNSVRFTEDDISRLDDHAEKQRKINSSQTQTYRRLSQLLRALGDHLDRMEVNKFTFPGLPVQLLSIFTYRMVGLISERSPLKNWSNWDRIRDLEERVEFIPIG